jgi:2,5-diamino-6-(ribosylamino)-4(3H)-pyrimidinone 5'-phosphate reductase
MEIEVRPYVICHMCTTIDGKILVDRWGRLPGGMSGGALFETTAASFRIGSWLVGTRTMKEFSAKLPGRLASTSRRIPHEDHLADPTARRFAIGADAKGVLRFKKNEVEGDHVVLLLTNQVSRDYLAHLQVAQVSYLFCGKNKLNLGLAMAKIGQKLNIRKLMLQGGGTFNGAVLAAGLVDEISQVVVPIVDGGSGVTSAFEITEPLGHAAAKLRPIKHRTLRGGVHWFRYRVIPTSRAAKIPR